MFGNVIHSRFIILLLFQPLSIHLHFLPLTRLYIVFLVVIILALSEDEKGIGNTYRLFSRSLPRPI